MSAENLKLIDTFAQGQAAFGLILLALEYKKTPARAKAVPEVPKS